MGRRVALCGSSVEDHYKPLSFQTYMSEDTTQVSSTGYLSNVRIRIQSDLDDVIDNNASASDFINFIVEEIYTSYQRGVEAGRLPRKKAFPKKGKARRY